MFFFFEDCFKNVLKLHPVGRFLTIYHFPKLGFDENLHSFKTSLKALRKNLIDPPA